MTDSKNFNENVSKDQKDNKVPFDEINTLENADTHLNEDDAEMLGSEDSEVISSESVSNRKRSNVLAIIITIFIVGFLYQSIGSISSGYFRLMPGPTPIVNIIDNPRLPTQGTYIFTTVKVQELDYKSFLWAAIRKDLDGVTKGIESAGTDEEAVESAYLQMEDSKRNATLAAESFVTSKNISVFEEVKILTVKENSPAFNSGLEPGDIITKVNSIPTPTNGILLKTLNSLEVNSFPVEILRGDDVLSIIVNVEGTSRTLGVETVNVSTMPSLLNVDTGEVGGGSGGLMFALADIDALTGGDLTGGRLISGTGTIDADGFVGPVGGTKYKSEAASKQGSSIFFSPAEDALHAKLGALEGTEVVSVTTLEEAVSYLCETGAKSPVC